MVKPNLIFSYNFRDIINATDSLSSVKVNILLLLVDNLDFIISK